MVETALVMVFVLLPMLMAIIKFGVAFNNEIILTDAVAVGARTLATSRSVGNATPNACTLATTALQTAAVGLNTSNIKVTITFTSTNPTDSTCTAMNSGDTGTVRATYPLNLQILFLNLNPSNYVLASQTSVRIE